MSVQLTVCISILKAKEILQIPEHKCALLQKAGGDVPSYSSSVATPVKNALQGKLENIS